MQTAVVERRVLEDGTNYLVTIRDLEPGDLIFKLTGRILAKPNRYTIQIGECEHIEDHMGVYMNHHCFPNAVIEGLEIRAICSIPKDTELTFNYNETEDRLSHPFVCNCCGQWILGKEVGSAQTLANGPVTIHAASLQNQ